MWNWLKWKPSTAALINVSALLLNCFVYATVQTPVVLTVIIYQSILQVFLMINWMFDSEWFKRVFFEWQKKRIEKKLKKIMKDLEN